MPRVIHIGIKLAAFLRGLQAGTRVAQKWLSVPTLHASLCPRV